MGVPHVQVINPRQACAKVIVVVLFTMKLDIGIHHRMDLQLSDDMNEKPPPQESKEQEQEEPEMEVKL